MKTIQYTIRNIPEPVNHYLRRKALQTGKSLNQVIIDELSEKIAKPTDNLVTSLQWFIGSGMDDETLRILDEEEKIQKGLASRDI